MIDELLAVVDLSGAVELTGEALAVVAVGAVGLRKIPARGDLWDGRNFE